jgi:phage/plasmid-associated DNA primase
MSSDSSNFKTFPHESRPEFSPEEEQRFLIEEELKKYKDDLGEDYEPLKDIVRRMSLKVEPGFVSLFYEGAKLYEVEDTPFGKGLKIAVEGLLYRTGIAIKLRDLSRAVEVLGGILFDIKKLLKDRRLWDFAVELKLRPFNDRLQLMIDKISMVVEELLKNSTEYEGDDFKSLKTLDKTKVVCEVLNRGFTFVRVEPREPTQPCDYYVLDDTTRTLYLMENVIEPICGALVKEGLASKNLKGEVEAACKATKLSTTWDRVDPWDKLNLGSGILDLRTLKLTASQEYYFRYWPLPVSITQEEIDEIRRGSYDIRENEFYKTFRPNFDDENWGYLEDTIGCILAPFSLKHIAFIKGGTNAGKSTLLDNLTRPISPIVGRVSLRAITLFGGSYPFGLEGLIGKQLNVYMEKGARILRNIDVINNLVGGKDWLEVHRKRLPPTMIRSLKTMIFAMNDLPVIQEYGGGEMEAFLNRLSIITMRRPEGVELKPEVNVDPKETFKFMLYCRCRLEERDWKIRKMDEEKMLELLMEASNPVLQFLESDWVITDPSAKVEGTKLYEAYVAWCRERGIKSVGREEFYSMVASKFYKRREEGRVWFRGLMINPARAREQQSTLEGL